MSEDIALSDPDAKAKLKLGLFSYPVLQAADILLYRATHVPVGPDQAQHLEFARENAKNFNVAHAPAKRIMSLKDPLLKMSKSHQDPRSRIMLNDSPDDIQAKVKGALTDSVGGISFNPGARPGVSNLLTLMALMDEDHRLEEQIAAESEALSMRAFKEEVARTIIKGLGEIKTKYDYFIDIRQRRRLQDVAALGNQEARRQAEDTMVHVRRLVGTDPM
ncbi:MAG: hypothetical protein Q9207_008139 [Kuettlingeria erythrocarpa]